MSIISLTTNLDFDWSLQQFYIKNNLLHGEDVGKLKYLLGIEVAYPRNGILFPIKNLYIINLQK